MAERNAVDTAQAEALVNKTWDESIVPALAEYIKIPNKSPMFDARWREHGYMDQAVELVRSWCADHALPGMRLDVVREGDRTPVIFIEIPGTVPNGDETVLMYGHIDKQPEAEGWDEDLGPWKPVLRDGKLYGRGAADDGYAVFGSLTALTVLAEQGIPYHRCVILVETCEESGSYDLPFYMDHLADRIGTPSLVVCLDTACGNYDQLWLTTSLRGIVTCDLDVSLLYEGVHSGDASGIVADGFRVARQLLSRVEDETSGAVKLDDLQVEIPTARVNEARRVAAALGDTVFDAFPLQSGARPVTEDLTELLLNRTWRPALSITGAEGLPTLRNAGNVSRPHTALKLSMRLPPTLPARRAAEALVAALTRDPPYGAQITVGRVEAGDGWNAPMANWLEESLNAASWTYFGAEALYMGEGGSIPLIAMLGEKFPAAQLLITGVLGPHSNAHGPNEFLHIPTAKRVTACVANALRDHAAR